MVGPKHFSSAVPVFNQLNREVTSTKTTASFASVKRLASRMYSTFSSCPMGATRWDVVETVSEVWFKVPKNAKTRHQNFLGSAKTLQKFIKKQVMHNCGFPHFDKFEVWVLGET